MSFAGLGLLPKLFVFRALRDEIAERSIGAGEVGFGNRGLVVDIDDLLVLRKGQQLLFRFLEAQLELLNFVFEESLRGGVGLKALIEICGHEGVGVGVGDALSPLGGGVGVAEVN